MNFFPTNKSGGGSISPQTTTMSTYNQNWSNVPISVISGSTYSFCFMTDSTADVSVTNATILYKQLGNGDSISGRIITTRLLVITANSNSISIICSGGVYGLILAQLD